MATILIHEPAGLTERATELVNAFQGAHNVIVVGSLTFPLDHEGLAAVVLEDPPETFRLEGPGGPMGDGAHDLPMGVGAFSWPVDGLFETFFMAPMNPPMVRMLLGAPCCRTKRQEGLFVADIGEWVRGK